MWITFFLNRHTRAYCLQEPQNISDSAQLRKGFNASINAPVLQFLWCSFDKHWLTMVYWLPSAWTYGIKPAGTFLHHSVAATWNAFSQTHLIAGIPNQVPDSWAALWYNSCIGRSIAALPCRSPHHTPCKWGCNVLQSCLLCLMMYLIYVITIPVQSCTFFSAGVFLADLNKMNKGAKPTYNPGLPIDAYPISLLASRLRSGLVCHEPLQFWHRYVSGQPPSMKKYEKNPKECTNQSSCHGTNTRKAAVSNQQKQATKRIHRL